MIELDWDELLSSNQFRKQRVALAVGVFDGLHLGHRKLIERVVKSQPHLLPVVVTFRQNPRHILTNQTLRTTILPFEQKLKLLAELGIKLIVAVDFSQKFSKMKAIDFVKNLTNSFLLKKIVVGENFYFGRNREASAQILAGIGSNLGILVDVVNTVQYKGSRVSSTRLRHLLTEGNFQEARAMMLSDYRVWIPPQADIQKEESYCQLLLKDLTQLVPTPGQYRCILEGEELMTEQIINISQHAVSWYEQGDRVKAICFKEKIKS